MRKKAPQSAGERAKYKARYKRMFRKKYPGGFCLFCKDRKATECWDSWAECYVLCKRCANKKVIMTEAGRVAHDAR